MSTDESENKNNKKVQLDLNNEIFLDGLSDLDKDERNRVLETLKKIRKMTWDQVYRDPGLKWEKIVSVSPPKGIDAMYSLRVTKSRRATAFRYNNLMCLLTVERDHDSTYGKK